MADERGHRRNFRVRLDARISLSWRDSGGQMRHAEGHCLDMSESGLRVEVPQLVAPAKHILFRIDSVDLYGAGSVRHCRQSGSKTVIGFEFTGRTRWLAVALFAFRRGAPTG